MHLQVIIAFALLLWWPLRQPQSCLVTANPLVLAIVWGKIALITGLAAGVTVWIQRKRRNAATAAESILIFYHRAATALRLAALAGFAADVFLTAWPQMLESIRPVAAVPAGPELMAIVPYTLTLIATWWAFYPIEKSMRTALPSQKIWTRWQFIVFNLRHQLLIVAVPLGALLVVYAATRDYRDWFVRVTGSRWANDFTLGVAVILVFILSPVLLRLVWSTSPLPDGPLRRKLLAVCERVGLRVREILVWHSQGVFVNAAVMGIFPRVRYILLSDALLESMTDEEVEAVFGHEAGHVRHHHIQFFLLFALVSMLIMSGVIELLTRMSTGPHPAWVLNEDMIQVIGFIVVLPIWALGFGWVSRRFERQADVFGAICASPVGPARTCDQPCAVHQIDQRDCKSALGPTHGVCAIGAMTFVSALRKVARLNGIPPAERSWRHSSIASRIRFLTALSADPALARRFTSLVARIKIALLFGTAFGLICAATYIWWYPPYRHDVMECLIKPLLAMF